MFDRISAIRTHGTKVALGAVIVASLAVAACGTPSTSTSTGTTPTSSTLTACTVTADQLVTGTGGTGTATKVAGISGKLSVSGSSALQPLVQAAAAEFDSANGTQTSVAAGGSGKGLSDVNSGAVQIGMSDVFASQKESTPGQYSALVDHQVAVVAFTLVVSNDLAGKVSNLTSDQIKQIFTGQITNWSQIGGPNELISVVNRPAASGTRSTFDKWVLQGTKETAGSTLTEDNTGAVATAVKATPGSIGYVSIGFVTGSHKGDVTPICIDGAKAVATDISSGNYKFWGVEHMYTKGNANAYEKALMQYILSDQVQKNDLLRLSYIPIGSVAASAITAHTPSGAPAPENLG
jgi:phosphate transport system substrate-binding protein